MSGEKKRRNDTLLIAVLLLLSGALALFLRLGRQPGGSVTVSVNGEVLSTLPLDRDLTMTIGEGEHTNLLVIENGAARIAQASCPDLLCVRQGEIRYAGQSIVCLPNSLVVSVEQGEDGGFDAVAR